MTTRTAAFNARNDVGHDARNGRRTFASETRLTSGSKGEDVESVFSSLSYLLEGDEPPPPPDGAAHGPSDHQVIEVDDSDVIEIDEGWHESGPSSVTARVIVDPHTLATMRPERMDVPADARRSRGPHLRPRPRDGLTPLMATLTAAASAAPPEVSSEQPVTAMVVAAPPARRWPAPPPPAPLPAVDRTAAARVATASPRQRPHFIQASRVASAAFVAGACLLAFFHVRGTPSAVSGQPAALAPAAAPAPASVAARAPAPVDAPSPIPTPPPAVPPADDVVQPAAAGPAFTVRPQIRIPGPMPVARVVAAPLPPAAPPPPAVTVKHATIPSTGPVLPEDH